MYVTDFSFEKDLETSYNIEDLHERLLFFKRRLKELKQISEVGGYKERFEEMVRQYSEEIKYQEDLIKYQLPHHKMNPLNQDQGGPILVPPTKLKSIQWRGTLGQLIYLFEQL